MKFVYLIKKEIDSTYKIGVSKFPNERLKQLETASDSKLILINTYKTENYNKIEKTLHNLYSHNRKNNEWFSLTLEDEQIFSKKCKKIDKTIKILKKNNNFFI